MLVNVNFLFNFLLSSLSNNINVGHFFHFHIDYNWNSVQVLSHTEKLPSYKRDNQNFIVYELDLAFIQATPLYLHTTPLYLQTILLYLQTIPLYLLTTLLYLHTVPLYLHSMPLYLHTTSLYLQTTLPCMARLQYLQNCQT